MMWYPNLAATRTQYDREQRTLYACLGLSLALHGLAMLSFPAFGPTIRADDARALTAMFAPRSEPSAVAAAPRQRQERREVKPTPQLSKPIDTVPLEAPRSVEAAPVSVPEPQRAPAPVASASDSLRTEAPAQPPLPVFDSSLFDAYRLALIDRAKRFKRYPVQAIERGWEGRVEVRVVVGADGMIKSALVKSSSRYQMLDEQALEMVKRAFNALAQERPAPRGREFTVDVPVIFELQTG